MKGNPMPVVMPWFLPLATGMGYLISRTAMGLFKERGRRRLDGSLLLILAWFPLLIWLLAQFTSPASRLP
jgi:flagellar biogenesis protein FliO